MVVSPWAVRFGWAFGATIAGLVVVAAGLAAAPVVRAQDSSAGAPDIPAVAPVIEGYWPVERELTRPDLGDLETIRFITEDDYPPFNYLDSTGVLVGFNIDIAWGICTVLKVRCTVRRVAWEKMERELDEGRADAAIASHRISEANRERFLFTDRYYDTPARFVMRKDVGIAEITARVFVRKPVAVLRGTAHEAYLRTFFPLADVRPFDGAAEAREALRTGAVTALFGDAVSLAFWLDGTASHGCCRFVGGAYREPKFFGNGVGIAIKGGNYRLVRILNYGLDQIRRSGLYAELWQRHFPQALY
jgi:polar amino acid transport system substrate-binding protein